MTIGTALRSKLDTRDTRIISWRAKGYTYRALAEKYDLSQARIVQIVAKAKKNGRRRKTA